MPIEIAGIGEFALAFETTYGTFAPPTKFFPIRSESLQKVRDNQYRMNIRGLADRQGPMPSYTHVEGDVEIECTSDVLPYFLYAARVTPSRSGGGPYVYTFEPANVTLPTTESGVTKRKTLSLYVKRAGTIFGYNGCNIGRFQFSVDGSILIATMSVFGIDEQDTSNVVPDWPSSDPYGAGEVTIDVGPVSSGAVPRVDIETASIEVQDNMVNEQRLKTGTGPAYNRWGEREVSGSLDMDFADKDEYDHFVARDTMELILHGSHGVGDTVDIAINAAAWDAYPVGLSGLGDLVKASVDYHGFYEDQEIYTITVGTDEDVTAIGS